MHIRLAKWGKVGLILALTIGVLGGFYALIQERNHANSVMESVYERSFYDLLMDVNDVEIKLEKLSVSENPTYQEKLLREVGERATLANANISQLTGEDGVLSGTTSYINQLGDFSKSLSKKLEKGGRLSREDKESLANLHEISVEVGKRLQRVRDKIGQGKTFIENFDDISVDFGEIDELSVDYPELIYDGPFSDSVVNKAPKGISKRQITEEEGLEIAKRVLKGVTDEVEFIGVWEGKIKTYNYSSPDGDVLVKLTSGGDLLSFSSPTPFVDESQVNEIDGVKIAYEFLYTNGYDGLVPVWVSNYYGNLYINFVHEESGVIVYNDMVKVKVSGETGKVVGFEGTSYLYNHTEREIGVPAISEDEAREKVYGEIEVDTVRLALVPDGEREKLSYEVYGKIGEKKYFVYVDAKTGEEINILCVIDSEQGELLM